jgi:hypothetical protein
VAGVGETTPANTLTWPEGKTPEDQMLTDLPLSIPPTGHPLSHHVQILHRVHQAIDLSLNRDEHWLHLRIVTVWIARCLEEKPSRKSADQLLQLLLALADYFDLPVTLIV